jgi:hypothetical protein
MLSIQPTRENGFPPVCEPHLRLARALTRRADASIRGETPAESTSRRTECIHPQVRRDVERVAKERTAGPFSISTRRRVEQSVFLTLMVERMAGETGTNTTHMIAFEVGEEEIM